MLPLVSDIEHEYAVSILVIPSSLRVHETVVFGSGSGVYEWIASRRQAFSRSSSMTFEARSAHASQVSWVLACSRALCERRW